MPCTARNGLTVNDSVPQWVKSTNSIAMGMTSLSVRSTGRAAKASRVGAIPNRSARRVVTRRALSTEADTAGEPLMAIARANRPLARGMARRSMTATAPPDWPKTVT